MRRVTANPLIDARALSARLADADCVVVDCRFTLTDPSAGRAAYDRGHIPGARYADLDRDLARRPGPSEGRHPLPDPDAFARTLGRWGVDNRSTVVAYDEASGAIAARLWWMLGWLGHERRLVLDGGFAAWQAAGLAVEAHEPRARPATFAPQRIHHEAVVATNGVAAAQGSGALLVDARAPARYRGEQEPIDPVAGHVPGAVNRPHSENVGSDGRFRDAAQLRRDLAKLIEGRPSGEVVAMCGSGVTACHLLLAMAVAGLDVGRLYAGSWSEWIRDPARPIRTGAAP
jgi:thiosulfate/3-mercaptopyruvate sulfurtransferase